MQKEFFATLKRKSHRQRFYSSMNYDEYCDAFGPPSPFVKPQDDPEEDIPPLDLEKPAEKQSQQMPLPEPAQCYKMDTIVEIQGSQNFTQNLQRSPRIDGLGARRGRQLFDDFQAPKRMRIRMRSQSDNSQYLIFNFLERISDKGRKRVKIQ